MNEEKTTRRFSWVTFVVILVVMYFLSLVSDEIVARVYVPEPQEPSKGFHFNWERFSVNFAVYAILMLAVLAMCQAVVLLKSKLETKSETDWYHVGK